jgi:hypothetical protein
MRLLWLIIGYLIGHHGHTERVVEKVELEFYRGFLRGAGLRPPTPPSPPSWSRPWKRS